MDEFRTGDHVVTPLGKEAIVVARLPPPHIRCAYVGADGKPIIHWSTQAREEVDLPESILRRKA